LPQKVLDILSKHAEKVAPESLEKMCQLAATIKPEDL
jgi:hypothetical protein